MCNNCITGNEQSRAENNTKKELSSGMDRSASPVRDNCSLNGQLEALRLNGVCIMEMVQSLMEMVTKLSCEVQALKRDNTALKLQLRDLRQILTPQPSVSTEAPSSTHDASAKTYREVLTPGGGHPASTAISSEPNRTTSLPESTVMATDNQESDSFITVSRKKKEHHPSSIPSGVPNPPRRTRTPLFANKSGSSLSVVPKMVRIKALFVSRFSPDVTSADVEQSLKDQLELTSLTCTKLKTKFNSYSSFHIAVSEDDFHLISNTEVCPIDCLIVPYYGHLDLEQIYFAGKSAVSKLPSPPTGVPTADRASSFNYEGALVEVIDTLG
jgi:hypothetical protein